MLDKARESLSASDSYSSANIHKAEKLKGDAGTRQYYRLHLSGTDFSSAILMLLSQHPGPVGGGANNLSQDDTFIELQHFFSNQQIPVPKIYIDERKEDFLIIEDVGDLGLWKFAYKQLPSKGAIITKELGSDYLFHLYKSALDIIGQLQSITKDSSSIAFQREMPEARYRTQISHFTNHIATSSKLSKDQLIVLNLFFDKLCDSLALHPKALSHFDYMSHNVHVRDNGELVLIDFQDAIQTSSCRDVFTILNDRGIDEALGEPLQKRLLQYYIDHINKDPDFIRHYEEMNLYWSFRVSGLFRHLSSNMNMPTYQEWIPGTLRRLGRTLFRSQTFYPEISELLKFLPTLANEIAEGVEDPWPFD